VNQGTSGAHGLRSMSARWLSFVALAALVACGGGGSGSGETGFESEGKGDPVFGGGAGEPPFGGGAGGGGGLEGDGPLPSPDAAVTVSDADLQGTVFNANSGSPISGAAVRFDSTTLTTASDGTFEQASSTADPRLVLDATASSYETLYLPTEVLGTVPSVNLLRLTPFGTAGSITVADGGTVTDTASGAAVTVDANVLVAPGGTPPAPTTVDVRVSNVAVGSDSHLLSGDYSDDNGDPVEAYGSVVLTAVTAAEVASTETVSLRIPVSTRTGAPPATANLYRLIPSTGSWISVGTATLSGTAYIADVPAFGQWMVGSPIASAVAVTGCVNDDTGAAAANVRVEADGISYSGISYATTDGSGQFSLAVRPTSTVLVSGRRGAFLTNATSRTVANSTVDITPCLTLPSSNAATMRLTWGENPRDIDSHLRTPDGAHVFYAAKGTLTGAPFASLDVDDVTGFGPEVTTIRRPKAGIYRFYLHNFSGTFSPGMTGSPTRVELNYVGRTVVFTPPSGEGSARYWHLFDLRIAEDCTMTLYRYNRWRADEPQNPNTATTTAQECVP
jgi:hypothetical protein